MVQVPILRIFWRLIYSLGNSEETAWAAPTLPLLPLLVPITRPLLFRGVLREVWLWGLLYLHAPYATNFCPIRNRTVVLR